MTHTTAIGMTIYDNVFTHAMVLLVAAILVATPLSSQASGDSALSRLFARSAFAQTEVISAPNSQNMRLLVAANTVPLIQGTSQTDQMEDIPLAISNDDALVPQVGPMGDAAFGDMSVVLTKSLEVSYEVQSGDSLATIGRTFGISKETLAAVNGLSTNATLKEGAVIRVPAADGLEHKVKKNETVAKIAKTYKAKTADILDYNEIENASSIQVGQTLFVPGGEKPVVKTVVRSTRSSTSSSSYPTSTKNIAKANRVATAVAPGSLLLPVANSTLTSSYGMRTLFGTTRLHEGLDFGADRGEPIVASISGTFRRSASRGYGNYVDVVGTVPGIGQAIVRNGHLSRFVPGLSNGDYVTEGQVIGYVGSTGRSTGNHTHFEVRKITGNKSRAVPINMKIFK